VNWHGLPERGRAVLVDVATRVSNQARHPVAYIGSARSPNIGDQAVFDALNATLPGTTLLPVEAARREHWLSQIGLSGSYFRAAVLGGGTMINDFSLPIVREFLRQGVRMAALGTGVGRPGWDHSEDVDLRPWVPLLSRFEVVGVRGPRSCESLRALGARNVEVFGDLALALTRPVRAETRSQRVLWNMLKGPASIRWNAAYEIVVVDAIRQLARSGWQIVPFAMHPSDERYMRGRLRHLGLQGLQIWQPASTEELIDEASTAGLVVSMRLHGAVLGVVAGAPTVSLAYLDKCLDFAESVGIDAFDLTQAGTAAELESSLARCIDTAHGLAPGAHARALEHRLRLRQAAAGFSPPAASL
jgi:polysaccharide pyruvyl transferase WcaK-like protein